MVAVLKNGTIAGGSPDNSACICFICGDGANVIAVFDFSGTAVVPYKAAALIAGGQHVAYGVTVENSAAVPAGNCAGVSFSLNQRSFDSQIFYGSGITAKQPLICISLKGNSCDFVPVSVKCALKWETMCADGHPGAFCIPGNIRGENDRKFMIFLADSLRQPHKIGKTTDGIRIFCCTISIRRTAVSGCGQLHGREKKQQAHRKCTEQAPDF